MISDEWMEWDKYLRTVVDLDALEPDFAYIPTELLLEHRPGDRTAVLERVTGTVSPTAGGGRPTTLDYAITVAWAEGVEPVVEWLGDHDEFPRTTRSKRP